MKTGTLLILTHGCAYVSSTCYSIPMVLYRLRYRKGLVKSKKFSSQAVEQEKERQINVHADFSILLYAWKIKKENEKGLFSCTPIVVCEEYIHSEDGKLFKKIPEIDKQLDIKVITMAELLKEYLDIDLVITKGGK